MALGGGSPGSDKSRCVSLTIRRGSRFWSAIVLARACQARQARRKGQQTGENEWRAAAAPSTKCTGSVEASLFIDWGPFFCENAIVLVLLFFTY